MLDPSKLCSARQAMVSGTIRKRPRSPETYHSRVSGSVR
nr:hypothetical protein JVH1_4871 [Rhodococcus sp. JVH1]